ncbi:GGDEF domain-containing protein [Winslowiella iniecta]|uniref:diguanylate cyclase n=1 Tax=Winslowiella iniecta TaxID=1560201 RepID=A0A0L7T9A3_9GAMM|nr:GGDEF domain-containing protein [Winslowiella iniecta]KOC91945.1 cellulose synthase [Winslowiella iniecta]KOC94933.1 cellulose synthase [Winslowiella iniecta]
MPLDVYTLYICELFVLGFVSIIMVFAWSGTQYDRVLGYSCLSMGLTLLAVFLSSLRSFGFQFLPIFVGNLLLMLAYGMLLNAFRSFCGKPVRYHWVLGALIWAILCLFPGFYHSLPQRIFVCCVLCILYTSALIILLVRSRASLQVTFWPAQFLLWVHLLFHIARMLIDTGSISKVHGAIGGSTFSLYVILESILFVIGVTFTILAMVNERSQIMYKQASLRDPLTGVWNRRALFNQADKLTLRCSRSAEPLSVILFDLDHFKSINDRYGHYQGDRILLDFCQVVQQILPADGHFARLGGEEFAAILVVDEPAAASLSEQIRSAVLASLPDNVSYSVSIGYTTRWLHQQPFAESMVAADEALYRAKANGRNRVEAFISPALV